MSRRIRGEQILVPIAGSMDRLDSIYALNESATLICRLAVDGKSDEEIAAELVREFNVDPDAALADTRQTLDELVTLGALQPV